MKKTLLLVSLMIVLINAPIFGQGYFSGDFQTNVDFYIRDTTIGASETPHYDNLKSSADAWLNVNYINPQFDFEAGLRFDMFLNSNLHNPGTPYTALGLGTWYARKGIKDLTLTAGYFYDEFGSGIPFRSYEDRGLGIDNSIFGLHLNYALNQNWNVTALGGLQKARFNLHQTPIIGLNLDGYVPIKDGVDMVPGVSVVNRTLDDASMQSIVSTIETFDPADRFVPKYNFYILHAYNTLNVGNFSWYVEGAYKTEEAVNKNGTLTNTDGNVLYTTLTFAKRGFGITGQFKRTENYVVRTSPNEILLDGMINFVPPTARQNSLRLLSRYNAATQEFEEMAASLDVTFKPAKGLTFNVSLSQIYDFEGNDLFREAYIDSEIRKSKKVKALVGFQYILYNQKFYEGQNVSDVTAYTPFTELTFKFDKKKSLKTELQYQHVEKDFGQWVYGLAEFNIAPRWSFGASDMWNFKPNPDRTDKDLHYYSVYASMNHKSNKFTASFVRQVEGIVCTGGVCRFEPAFSGVKLSMTSSF